MVLLMGTDLFVQFLWQKLIYGSSFCNWAVRKTFVLFWKSHSQNRTKAFCSRYAIHKTEQHFFGQLSSKNCFHRSVLVKETVRTDQFLSTETSEEFLRLELLPNCPTHNLHQKDFGIHIFIHQNRQQGSNFMDSELLEFFGRWFPTMDTVNNINSTTPPTLKFNEEITELSDFKKQKNNNGTSENSRNSRNPRNP